MSFDGAVQLALIELDRHIDLGQPKEALKRH